MEGSYTITTKEDAQSVTITVPRRLPLPLMAKTKKELIKMEEMGVITRIEQPTDWCPPVVVVPKKDDVGSCVDLTKLNESVFRERHEIPSFEYTLGQLAGTKIFTKLDANSGFWQVPLSVVCLTIHNIHNPVRQILLQPVTFWNLIQHSSDWCQQSWKA